ncbi:hypothetical protein [Planctomicrobium piriforme]|uniref:Uncharacterized protein n=1 Tax=Planctomicrobium piriforme TaxID=1576369 RepID=A0A1I3N959_9PLAN|nr:hypothetical protein [Planctomicrobium piriforme]SFJ05366.1 hypothetical protein SAMN05421753_11521 [Planctomicrobium piriforme]
MTNQRLAYWIPLFTLIELVGCSEHRKPQSVTIHQPIAEQPVPIPAPAISPGGRPRSIRNARYFTVSDFLAARKNNELTPEEWVCIEGHVTRAIEVFGAFGVTLSDSNSELTVHSEGKGLRQYTFNSNDSIIIHGRLSKNGLIADPTLLTQQEVDPASSTGEQLDMETGD